MPSDLLIRLIGLVAWFPRWQLLNAGLLSSRYLPAPILAAILDANAHICKPQAPHQWKIKAWNNVQCNYFEKATECLKCLNCNLPFCENDLLSKSCTSAWLIAHERAHELVNSSLINET